MARRRTATTALGLWTDAMASAAAASVTLAVRVPQIAAGTMSAAETTRMVGEKTAAAAEGLLAGSAAAARVGVRRLVRPAPLRAFDDALEIVDAATRPARRRVKANAKRLSKARDA